MAWPPPTLPTNRTNATPQLDTHAADHNALALAMNDTVNQVKANTTNIVRHDTHTDQPSSFGAGSATTVGTGIGPISLAQGVWFVGYSIDLAPVAGTFGYVDFYPSLADVNAFGVPLVAARTYDTGVPSRMNLNGLWIVTLGAGGGSFYIRARTLAGTVAYNGITLRSWAMSTP